MFSVELKLVPMGGLGNWLGLGLGLRLAMKMQSSISINLVVPKLDVDIPRGLISTVEVPGFFRFFLRQGQHLKDP